VPFLKKKEREKEIKITIINIKRGKKNTRGGVAARATPTFKVAGEAIPTPLESGSCGHITSHFFFF
jgi:hypothetical protein